MIIANSVLYAIYYLKFNVRSWNNQPVFFYNEFRLLLSNCILYCLNNVRNEYK